MTFQKEKSLILEFAKPLPILLDASNCRKIIFTTNSLSPMWYYNANGQALGPIEENVILQMISQGRIPPQTMVWKEGQADWLPATQTTLAQSFEAPVLSYPAKRNNPYAPPQSHIRTAYAQRQAVPLTWLQILFGFTGRIPRWQFWVGTVVSILPMCAFIGLAMGEELRAELGEEPEPMSGGMMAATLISFAFCFWISLAVQIKRWHDRDKSGWWIFIGAIPLIGPIWALIETGFLSGSIGTNQYEAPPA
jgi:uncharacterized membrane protein YhaH (DUF805 family)